MNKKFAALLVLSALLPISCGDNQQSSLNDTPPAAHSGRLNNHWSVIRTPGAPGSPHRLSLKGAFK